jgi:hypothetical protein
MAVTIELDSYDGSDTVFTEVLSDIVGSREFQNLADAITSKRGMRVSIKRPKDLSNGVIRYRIYLYWHITDADTGQVDTASCVVEYVWPLRNGGFDRAKLASLLFTMGDYLTSGTTGASAFAMADGDVPVGDFAT